MQDAAAETLPVLLPWKSQEKASEKEATSPTAKRPRKQMDVNSEGRDYFKTLPNQQGLSVPELKHVYRPTYAVNEEPRIESKVLVCIQKMKNGKSGGDDGAPKC
ncbi:hypothetical protein RB195_022196 [Necator americanus]|uniref:Uncharacterized protein n=1 Tax=Necator americanus TaxID=51031 RepID=A0ABR1EEB8_NECAM